MARRGRTTDVAPGARDLAGAVAPGDVWSVRRRGSTLLLLATIGGPAIAQAAQTHEVVLSLENADCAECGERATKAVAKTHGVKSATYDLSKAEIHVVAKDGVADDAIV